MMATEREIVAALGRVAKLIRAGIAAAEEKAARHVAPRLAGRARGSSAQSRAVAAAVDQVSNTVRVGGTVMASGESVPAADLFYGANFGAKKYPQFRWPMPGRDYWFFSGIRNEADALEGIWVGVVDDAIEGA